MHDGRGHLIRQALVHAKPWQRSLIGIVMLVGGGALVSVGHIPGVFLAGAGALLLWRMARHRLRRSGAIAGADD